jgi:hypothetical protein
MEVQMPQPVDVLGFEASDFAAGQTGRGSCHSGAVFAAPPALLAQAVCSHEPYHGRIARHGAQARVLVDLHAEVVDVQLGAPVRMTLVLFDESLDEGGTQRLVASRILADGPAQRTDWIPLGTQRFVVPTLDGLGCETHRLAGCGMPPRLARQRFDLGFEFAPARRRAEQRTHDRESQVRPSRVRRRFGIGCHLRHLLPFDTLDSKAVPSVGADGEAPRPHLLRICVDPQKAVISPERNLSMQTTWSSNVSAWNRPTRAPGSPSWSTGGMKRAFIRCQKPVLGKTVCHHTRQRASVRRSAPKVSRSARALRGVGL